MNGRDDLLGVDALQVDACRAEIGMPQLSLDDVERHALAGKLKRMRMTELVRCEPAPHPRADGELPELDPDPGCGPRPTARWTVDHAEQRADRQALALVEPEAELPETPLIPSAVAAVEP